LHIGQHEKREDREGQRERDRDLTEGTGTCSILREGEGEREREREKAMVHLSLKSFPNARVPRERKASKLDHVSR